MTDSHALLAEYAQDGSESAFRDLVTRYIDLVYSTALRQLAGDAHQAEDVTQTVFLHLARKAERIPRTVMLGGWLHQATYNVAATVVRGERRRQRREREAIEMNELQNDSPGKLDQIGPILDEVIGRLPEEDQAAVLLRFFEKRDFRSVGVAMGTSEDAARMRVNRALEKLQFLLKQRGVTVSATILGAMLLTDAVLAAPAGLAASVATNAMAGASVAGAAALLKFMAISKIKVGAICTVLIGGLITSVIVQHESVTQLRQENRSLMQQVEALRTATETAAKSPVDGNELDRLRHNESELLRLRAEVTALRKSQKTAALRSTSTDQTNAPGSAFETAPSITRLQANVRAQVGTGQTLLTGGWTNETGSRIFVLANPRIQGDTADQVGIKTMVFEVPGEALSRIGLDALKADGTESSLQQILDADQANLLVKNLKDTDGARLIAQGSLLTTDGRQAQIQTSDEQMLEGEKQSLGSVIDIVPVISNDKSAIELTLQAGINKPSAKR